MEALETLGGETWFRLGDRDLALHVERTAPAAAPARACPPSPTISAAASASRARLLPMSDDPVRTRLRHRQGWLDFQEYFVRLRCEPAVRELTFAGADGRGRGPRSDGARDPAARARW